MNEHVDAHYDADQQFNYNMEGGMGEDGDEQD